jgi:hypothetical protein
MLGSDGRGVARYLERFVEHVEGREAPPGGRGEGLNDGTLGELVRDKAQVLRILGCKCAEIVGELSAFKARRALELGVGKGHYGDGGRGAGGDVGEALVASVLDAFSQMKAPGVASHLSFTKVAETFLEYLAEAQCLFSREGAGRLHSDFMKLAAWAEGYDSTRPNAHIRESDVLDRAHAVVVVLSCAPGEGKESRSQETSTCVDLLVDLETWVGLRTDKGKKGREGTGENLKVMISRKVRRTFD